MNEMPDMPELIKRHGCLTVWLILMLIDRGVLVALPGLFGVIILFALLQMKTVSGSGWDNLK